MPTETAFNESELALRWNVSTKTLQRWRSEKRGQPYLKLVSKAVRYAVDDIPFYVLGDGSVIRFSIEELFRWEVHHLRPCRRAEADLGAARQRRTSS